jgi:hypothetical protein
MAYGAFGARETEVSLESLLGDIAFVTSGSGMSFLERRRFLGSSGA